MALELPSTMSPSKVSSFTDCALKFRYANIDRLPEPPSEAATKGTLVHLALEHLFEREGSERTAAAADLDFDRAVTALRDDPEFAELSLDADAEAAFFTDARRLLHRYFEVEDPTAITPIGIEIMLEARLGDLRLRGIIDRLELDDNGDLVVTDYKSGRSPGPAYQQSRLGGVTFYALLCQELFGVLPAKVQLIYLADATTITTTPTEQSTRGLRNKVAALWQAIERACEKEDFRPRPGPLCNWCSFHAYCPAQGGDPSLVPDAVAAQRAAEAEAAALRDAAAEPAA